MQVSGLSSGLDTAGMVKQLMQVERLQGSSLFKGRTASQMLSGALTTLNGYMKTLGETAKAFAPTSTLDASAFKAVSATSSNKDIATATTTDKATPGSLTFTVKSVATAGSGAFETTFKGTDVLNGGAAFDFNVEANGKTAKIAVGPDAKLADVAAAINQSGIDVKATMVQVAPDTYKLQIASQTTGSQSNVNVTDGTSTPTASTILGSFTQLDKGADTVLRVGDAATGYDITSPTRDVKDVLPGVTITPVKVDPSAVTIDLSADVEGMASKVEAMVKSANEALSSIRINGKWDSESKTGGPFVGDATTRQLSQQVQNAFVGTSSALPSLAGLELQKDGTVTFDKAKFTAAYAKDAAALEKTVGSLASRLGEVSKQATNPTDGLLTVRIQGEQALSKDYTEQIAKFEDRMSSRQQILERQFSALESMLGKLQAQGNWLGSQLATLPTGS